MRKQVLGTTAKPVVLPHSATMMFHAICAQLWLVSRAVIPMVTLNSVPFFCMCLQANCQIQPNTTRITAPTTSNCHCPLQNIDPDNVPDHNDNVVNKRKHPNNAAATAVLFAQHNSGALWMNADALLNHRTFPNYANVDPRGRSCCANNYENVNFIHQQQQSASVPLEADNKTLVDG